MDLWYHNMSSVKQAGVAAITNQLEFDDEVGVRALNAIYGHAGGNDPRPLAMVVSFTHPHDHYAIRQQYWDLYEHADIGLPHVARPTGALHDPHGLRLEHVIDIDAVDVTPEDIVRARRAYFGNVSYVDAWFGRLYAALQETGLSDNTTVVVTSDHGDMLGERGLWYKMTFRESASRIPLMISRPGLVPAGRSAMPCGLVDVLPTLTDIAAAYGQVPVPELIDPIDGTSLWPICRGDQAPSNRTIVGEYLGEGTVAPMRMLRDERYKYIACPTDPAQLFDLATDPHEQHNLAAQPAHASRCEAFANLARTHGDVDAVTDAVVAYRQLSELGF